MKKYSILLLAAGMISLTSCKKWLDVTPKTEMKADVLFSTQAGFNDALTGVYSLMIASNSYGADLTLSTVDVLAQTYDNPRSTAGHDFENVAKYLYTNAAVEGRFSNIWKQQYKAIVNANLILGNIDQKKNIFTAGNYELIKGEALALRALLHFDMLRLFSPSVVAGADKPAIPYVTAYTNVPVDQSNVTQVLEKAISDLEAARALLKEADTYGPDREALLPESAANELLKNRNFHLNYYAVTGLLARVSLYKGDKVKALQYAVEVINSQLFPMFELQSGTTPTQQADYIFPTEQLFCLKVVGLKDKYAAIYFPEITSTSSPSSLTINNTTVAQLFPAGINSDYRNNWLDVATSASKRITKYNFNTVIPMLKISEMYLVAAECEPDITAAVNAYMNVLRAHRGLAPLDASATTPALLETEIAQQYRQEFIAEGQLFYYYKRKNTRKLPTIPEFTDPAAIYAIPLPSVEIEFGNIK
ncbi:RagB/SusD family nutrient uptake outer membrane protein [Chitinophaga sp. sic0106]|uniref:RagB/SusD family nutrient uptake outer membrane protein n=1 Tax=Chitinophaga sp. sic0106 TaxID=2854785 RepID=UPI001C454E49|nr:RagB/SusD family nutrient uptake outer membrane protein [Chitinophaga sp. sic0106]MBV7533013.1 RagB/SusD family nutrient uptake outer membrane protein [Chitinophaga sp. sic0106]